MNSDKNYAELDQLIIGMKEAADSESAKINSRCREINARLPILMEQAQQLAEEHQQPRMDDSSDTNSRLADILSKGMSYEELARYAAEGWSWASFMEDAYEKSNTLQSLNEELEMLLDEADQLASRRNEIISTFDEIKQSISHRREVLEATLHGFNVSKIIKASNGGKKRVKNDPRTLAKISIKNEWADWQSGKKHYESKEDFARKMLEIHRKLTSTKVISKWCRTWEKM